jgi:hypothetical protein
MAPRDRDHVRVTQAATTEEFRPPGRNIGEIPIPEPVDRARHVAKLTGQLDASLAEGLARREQAGAAIPGATRGVYVEFESIPGVALEPARLDSTLPARPQLVSIRTVLVNGERVDRAVVWIPEGGQAAFIRRFTEYAATTNLPRPRNKDLVDRIDAIRLATLRSLWTDSPGDFPEGNDAVWWELWLRRHDDLEWDRMTLFAAAVDLTLLDRRLTFPDRIVALCRATPGVLARGLDSLDDLAELRKPRPLAGELPELDLAGQIGLAEGLAQRTTPAGAHFAAAAILDTGIFQGHPLLTSSLAPGDCHRLNPAWRLDDERGHGTQMAGLALYGSVAEVLSNGLPVQLSHRLESVRILPPLPLTNPPELYGSLTGEAVSRLEIAAPNRRRALVLAVTAPTSDASPSPETPAVGQPTSWSASIDALAAGLGVTGTANNLVFLRDVEDQPRRLFVISMGNVTEFVENHLARSDVEAAQDPAQAWNGLAVGAFTELSAIVDPTFAGWSPLAEPGELSPLSRTSVAFNRVWPAKPDIVVEGGNVAVSPEQTDFDTPPDLQLVTTRTMAADPRPFTTVNATSAATAQAGHIAAAVLSGYPDLWPEAVRALVIHSAEWTPAMEARFPAATTRQSRDVLRRRYGMGVPSLERALKSATDAVTLVVQDTIHPFDNEGRMREMHIHQLPWPTSVLEDLGEVNVRLRVTLSYFIEPNPGRRGWVQRYAYPSHGLRFALKHQTETIQRFRQRLNVRAREEDEGWTPQQAVADGAGWTFGPDLRTKGSLHTDIWTGTAVDLASRGIVAVYPVSGWWKQRPDLDRSDKGARYSLVVSISAPETEVDLWTPVANQVAVPIEITTEE